VAGSSIDDYRSRRRRASRSRVAVRILHPDPAFTPLSLGSPIVATIVCTIMAIYIFIGMVSYPNPVRTGVELRPWS
jgi:hypothetical protein